MAYITYVLQVGTVMGIEERYAVLCCTCTLVHKCDMHSPISHNSFRPEVLTMTASTALFFTFVQVVFLKLGMYLLNIGSQEPLVFFTDLIAYSGYQFVTYVRGGRGLSSTG